MNRRGGDVHVVGMIVCRSCMVGYHRRCDGERVGCECIHPPGWLVVTIPTFDEEGDRG